MAFVGLSDLPPGLFQFLVNLWATIQVTFVDVVAFLTEHTIDFLGGRYNVLSILLGSGLTVFITASLIRWVISIFTGG